MHQNNQNDPNLRSRKDNPNTKHSKDCNHHLLPFGLFTDFFCRCLLCVNGYQSFFSSNLGHKACLLFCLITSGVFHAKTNFSGQAPKWCFLPLPFLPVANSPVPLDILCSAFILHIAYFYCKLHLLLHIAYFYMYYILHIAYNITHWSSNNLPNHFPLWNPLQKKDMLETS